MNWILELAKLKFNLRSKKDLPGIAARALEEGQDSPSLRILAGLEGDDYDIDTYLSKALDELHVIRPDRTQSAWILVEYFIDMIVEREMDPHDALHSMIRYVYDAMEWDQRSTVHVGDSIGIEELYGLCDTYDDLEAAVHPWSEVKPNQELRDDLKEQIVGAAERYRTGYLVQRAGAPDR